MNTKNRITHWTIGRCYRSDDPRHTQPSGALMTRTTLLDICVDGQSELRDDGSYLVVVGHSLDMGTPYCEPIGLHLADIASRLMGCADNAAAVLVAPKMPAWDPEYLALVAPSPPVHDPIALPRVAPRPSPHTRGSG